ncbi:murein biosynthesis integral membrane protein MurJ [Priestia endophytica]|jgi:putative peptidoglycan lipid II flippase|uniref:murein biosynthesis integral membrane protein MurJ n=1 Tax=Priestia endophytica TaxID=135735 RepID=UPI002E225B41|nr:murein biosynthesis integral membrane protein MurJ [Priestia endophytica]MED4071395.1 murein biosynthesis integral membrane protein MurJ [Priestia endophytica]
MSKLKFVTLLFFVSTFVLKFSSMLRDVAITNYFGSTRITDAYTVSMVIPNAIVLFMLTGMKEAFLPSYYKYDAKGKGFSHLTNVVKGTTVIATLIALIGMMLSPFIVPLIYNDFQGEAKDVAIWTSVIYFASILLVGVNAVFEGYFDAQRKFSFSVFSQTIVVFCTIGGAIFFHAQLGIYSVPLGYLVGTLISFLIKLVYFKPANFIDWKQKSDWSEIKAFYYIFVPVGLTIAVGQVNLLVNSIFSAQLGDGAATNLNLAFRLINIPQAVFGVTIATIIFPMLARAKSQDDKVLFKRGIEKGLSLMFLFLAPTLAGMLILMPEVVKVVYERGKFTAEATAATSHYAIFYVGSALFYSIQAVIAKGFYTLEKGHYMLRVGIVSIICNVILNAILVNTLGASGLALSFSLVALIYSAITFTTLYKLINGFSLSYVGMEYGKVLIATCAMFGLLMLMKGTVETYSPNEYVYLMVMIIIGAISYFIVLFLTRSRSMKELMNIKQLKREASEGR